ncbi:serine hydrolase domain-containing protein [Paramicrobacterium fandaimingii]|uniref:serine hydrolase domain-containing protein n=1 Tax=Paramicrobacterium fandaimingii TaxID=2708079 RepID=UPI00141DA506|nr:serine hydrolase domain-containing protein [Microbacterium fandaimingii]
MRGRRHHSRIVTACAVLGVGLLALTACSGEAAPAITLPAQADAKLADETATLIDDAVAHAIEASASTGAIAGVWAPWSGMSLKGYGVTELDGDTKITADMAFRIGANTRPMTCAVLLALVDDGVVAVDDKVSEYLPTTVGVDGLTLEQLCQGTSGLGGYRGNLDKTFIQNPERVWSPNELYNDGMATHEATPGETFSTADTGYVLLGQALESATGKSFAELYETYIFSPLSLENTELPAPTDVELPDSSLHSYEALSVSGKLQCDKPFDESKQSSSIGYTSAGVVATADDLRAFSQAFAQSKLFSDEAAKHQEETRAISDDAESWIQYGFGTYHYGPLYGQSGDVPGFITASLSDPASGLTVVVMLNNSTAGSSLALSLAMQLASYASKLPAASGSKAPSIDLPWSAEQMNDQVSDRAVCQG